MVAIFVSHHHQAATNLTSSEVDDDGTQSRHGPKCTIEEFAIYFLNFVRSQTDEYTKGCPSPSNTPKKLLGPASNDSSVAVTTVAVAPKADTAASSSKSISRDLFAESIDATKKSDGKSPSFAGVEPFAQDATPVMSFNSSTPPMKNVVHTPASNRSANSSRNSTSIRSFRSPNDSKSCSDSCSPFLDTSSGSNLRGTHPHDKSRERRNFSSPICLGDFLTPSSGKQKQRKANSDTVDATTVHVANAVANEKDFPSFTPKGRTNRAILTSSTPQSSTPKSKPARRVVPTCISSPRSEFTSSAFHSENNILAVTHEDGSDSIRQVLKMQKDELRKGFQDERPAPTNLRALIQERMAATKTNVTSKAAPPIELDKIVNRMALDKFVAIYSIILDLNLVTNILTEFAYLVNLINVDADDYYERYPHMLATVTVATPCDGRNETATAVAKNEIDTSDAMDASGSTFMLLRHINNCVYFGLGVLKLQKHVLRLLDTSSIKVLLDNERLTTLDATIKDDLMTVYAHKMQLESSLHGHDSAFKVHNISMKVFYQQEQDTQINFPSSREFATFKKQRDTFYSILGLWESKHLNPTWDFEQELGRKVRSLLSLMDHPINMAHMAKLFISQLILSCNFNDASLDLPNVDPSKLSKLSQRLVAPSHFSTNFQFPRNQTFFKDFIIAAEHNVTFIEQLKIIITNELMEMNDSTFETLNLSTVDENDGELTHEYVVKPETLSNLSVLAKFLGLILARPFIYEFGVNTHVDSRQIELRNKIRPTIDVRELLRKSLTEQKLVVTLPWIVQFLAMLDAVSLRSEYYRQVFQLLYELYMMTTDFGREQPRLAMQPTSLFIVRSCLGWLFDQPNVPNDYYDYRQNRKPLAIAPTATSSVEMTAAQILVPKHIAHFFQSADHQVVLNMEGCKFDDDRLLTCALEKLSSEKHLFGSTKSHQTATSSTSTFDPLLENVLISACPFLADFRVSIMPKRNSKTVSRTGRYRHITTLFETNEPRPATVAAKTEDDAQTKLIEAFLHSQSLSVRRIVEFVQERVFSAVVKDFQVEILIPFKKSIIEEVDKVQSKQREVIYDELFRIYVDGEQRLLVKWQEFVKTAALDRIKKAFDALLPHETVDACKLTCINIAAQRSLAKMDEWRVTNLKGIEIFSKNIQDDVDKILKKSMLNLTPLETAFEIDLAKKTPWIVFNELQCCLHIASLTPDKIDYDNIIKMTDEIHSCVNDHRLPETMYKTTGTMTLHLLMLLVYNRYEIVSKELINQFVSIWTSKQFASFVVTPAENDDDAEQPTSAAESTGGGSENDSAIAKELRHDANYLFSMILSPAALLAQQYRPKQSFIVLADVLTALIESDLMTISFVNKQCVKLLRQEWVQIALDRMAVTIQAVVDNCKRLVTDENEALFLEMLADLIRDIDHVSF